MAEIGLIKRVKYAGDVHAELLKAGWDLDTATAFVNNIPDADVAPVRHGRWERTADGAALCTACKRKMNPYQYGNAFCSLCGAKMDG